MGKWLLVIGLFVGMVFVLWGANLVYKTYVAGMDALYIAKIGKAI